MSDTMSNSTPGTVVAWTIDGQDTIGRLLNIRGSESTIFSIDGWQISLPTSWTHAATLEEITTAIDKRFPGKRSLEMYHRTKQQIRAAMQRITLDLTWLDDIGEIRRDNLTTAHDTLDQALSTFKGVILL